MHLVTFLLGVVELDAKLKRKARSFEVGQIIINNNSNEFIRVAVERKDLIFFL